MVKSFLNSLFGGLGRTFGRIIAYIIIALIFFFIYENAHASSFTPSSINGGSCTSNRYDIEKSNGDVTYGVIGTSYNIFFHYISLYSTYNLQPNKYYDITITFISNINNNILNNDYGENLGVSGIHVFETSSLCGGHTGEVTISNYSISGKNLTIRVMNGSNLVDYWQLYTRFTFNGSNGISSTSIEAVDLSGSSGIIENANDNTNSIINNNNENTQDIIDNQNQNAQDIIDNQNFNSINELNALRKSANSNCLNYYDFELSYGKKSLDNYGALVDTSVSNYYTNQYVNIDIVARTFGNTLRVYNPVQSVSGYRIFFYDSSYNLISYINLANRLITIPTNTQYFRFVSPVPNTYIFRGNACVTGSDIINNSINDPSDVDTNIFSTWLNNYNPINNPLGSVITLPISLAEKIVSYNDDSCMTINLGSLLGTNLLLRCFSLSSVLPENASSLISTIDTIMSISLLVVIIKNSYETIANIISLGGENKVKSHFRLPTPLEFMSSLLNGNGYSEYVDYR